MAKVKWTIKADRLFDKYVFNAFLEYGRKTSQKWMRERVAFADRVAKHPESYTYCRNMGHANEPREFATKNQIIRLFLIVYK